MVVVCNNLCDFSELTKEKKTWLILARVVRLWFVSDFTKGKIPFSMEMVLVDNKGQRIHASLKKTIVYKFQKGLEEGGVYTIENFEVADNVGSYKTSHHSYKINFIITTKVVKMVESSVPAKLYDFVQIADVIGGNYDANYLVDIMEILKAVGSEKEWEKDGKKTKMNVIQVEADGFTVEVTLFGKYVDELNGFLATGATENVVVILHLGKVKCFRDKVYFQNCLECSKLIFNPECIETSLLRKRIVESMESPSQVLSQLCETPKMSLEQEFLHNTPRITILDLKFCRQEVTYIVFGTIKKILDEDDWYYTACVCGKAVYPDHKAWFCEKCNRHVYKVGPRYRIKVFVEDHSDSTTFVIFDRDATSLFHKSCSEMYEFHEKGGSPTTLPTEIGDLTNRTFLFKVESNNSCGFRTEQSFKVKKICREDAIITQFSEMYIKQVDSKSIEGCSYNAGKDGNEDLHATISQDLLPMFTSTTTECESQSSELQTIDLITDTIITPLKRDIAVKDGQLELQIPLKMLKKDIKIGKDKFD